jgi:hypothetical protein
MEILVNFWIPGKVSASILRVEVLRVNDDSFCLIHDSRSIDDDSPSINFYTPPC